jgi:hypothetical protein
MSTAATETTDSTICEYFCVYCDKDFQDNKAITAHLNDKTTDCYVINEDRKVNHPRTAAELEAEIVAVEQAAAELAKAAAELVAHTGPTEHFEGCKPERQRALCKLLHKEIDPADGTEYYYTRDDNLEPHEVTEEYTGVRNYLCRECYKTFYDKKYLKIHLGKFDKEKNECTTDDMWKFN